MTQSILLVAGGLVLLALGGELLVRGAVGMAARIGISPLLAGLTIVGFGTSMPELATSVQAAMAGAPGIAIGNVVGSNIANILLILGISALIMPLVVNPRSFKRDSIALGGSALLCTGAVLLGVIGPLPGVVLLVCLVGYIWYAYKSEGAADDEECHRHEAEAADVPVPPDTGPVTRDRPLSDMSGATKPPDRSAWPLKPTFSCSTLGSATRNTSPALSAPNSWSRYSLG